MLCNVNIFYDEITPLGTRQYRWDTAAYISNTYDERNAMYVRKALAFLVKLDRDDNKLCDMARFDFTDGTRWVCEVKWEDWNAYISHRADAMLITVEVFGLNNSGSTPDESYKTDKASLHRRLLAMLPKKSVA